MPASADVAGTSCNAGVVTFTGKLPFVQNYNRFDKTAIDDDTGLKLRQVLEIGWSHDNLPRTGAGKTIKQSRKKSRMAKKKGKKSGQDSSHIREISAEAVGAAQAKQAGNAFNWHYGRLTRMGHFGAGGGREVVIAWEEGGFTSQQGEISDEEWEIFKLAFLSTGRLAILSDAVDDGWMYDYRFLEAVR